MSANPKLRRVSRVSAVQALYQMDVSGAPHKTVVKEFLDHRFGYEEPFRCDLTRAIAVCDL